MEPDGKIFNPIFSKEGYVPKRPGGWAIAEPKSPRF